MDLKRVGIWSGELRRHAEHGIGGVDEAAAELEELGYGALFIPGGSGGDVLGAAGRLLGATDRIVVATGILNVWMHEPGEVTAGRAALVADHGEERFLLGLGVSHAPLVDREQEGRYRRPLSKMRSYLDALDVAGPPVPAGARVLAALGPRMLELARERSAGAHPYLVPVAHTVAARAALGEGPLLAPEQAVLLEPDAGRAREGARAHLERYLALPNYTNNLLRHGLGEDDLRDGGSDRLIDAIVAWGDEEAIAARVGAHHEAGADHVCVQVVGGEVDALPREAWRRLAPVLTGA